MKTKIYLIVTTVILVTVILFGGCIVEEQLDTVTGVVTSVEKSEESLPIHGHGTVTAPVFTYTITLPDNTIVSVEEGFVQHYSLEDEIELTEVTVQRRYIARTVYGEPTYTIPFYKE